MSSVLENEKMFDLKEFCQAQLGCQTCTLFGLFLREFALFDLFYELLFITWTMTFLSIWLLAIVTLFWQLFLLIGLYWLFMHYLNYLGFLGLCGLPSWQRDWTGPIMLIVLFLVSHF